MGITIKMAQDACGTLSDPGKMPGKGTSIPARHCITGSKLRQVPGSVCHGCYAYTGNYARPNVQAALDNRYSLLMASEHNPEPWIAGMVKLIWHQRHFRWYDSGDLQGSWHFANIVEVARRTPHVRHWLPTREYRMVLEHLGDIPDNLVTRLSAHQLDGRPPTELGYPTSTVVTDGSHTCPATLQGNKCGDCRNCWDATVQNVSYKHS
jgi:hypothetical protein